MWLAALVLAVPALLALVVEPPLFVVADRATDRRGFVRSGFVAAAVASLAAALAPTPWVMVAAFALCSPLWSVGVGVAEAALVELDLERAERQMARWTLAGAAGDVAGPLLVGAVAFVGMGWRAAFVTVAISAGLLAAFVPPLPRSKAAIAARDDKPGALPLRRALANRRLLAWAAGTFLCSLLDEILLVLAALHLTARYGADPSSRALVLGALLAGSAVGLFALGKLLDRIAPQRLLAAMTASCLVLYLAWIFAPSIPVSIVLAALAGFTISGQYPLAKAQAYRAAPGQAGTVNAVLALATPLDTALPLALAALAHFAGTTAALVALALQPAVLLLLSVTIRKNQSCQVTKSAERSARPPALARDKNALYRDP